MLYFLLIAWLSLLCLPAVHYGQKAQAKLDVSVKPVELIHWNHLTERLDLKDNSVNRKLEAIKYDFVGLPHRFKYDFEEFCPIKIKEKLFRNEFEKDPEFIMLKDYTDDYYTNVVLSNNNISKAHKNLQKSLNHLFNCIVCVQLTGRLRAKGRRLHNVTQRPRFAHSWAMRRCQG